MVQGQYARVNQQASGAKICSSGFGWFRNNIEPQPAKYQSYYDDPTRNQRGIKLTYEQAKAAYTCRHCGQWMGCRVCLESDLASLICKTCHDWANDLSQRVHGRMIHDAELKQQGLKLILMLYGGQVDREDYDKLWREACAVLRVPALDSKRRDEEKAEQQSVRDK